MKMKAIVIIVVVLIAVAAFLSYADTYDFSVAASTPATPQAFALLNDVKNFGPHFDFSFEARLTDLQVPAPNFLMEVGNGRY
jgi:hypothetical protein